MKELIEYLDFLIIKKAECESLEEYEFYNEEIQKIKEQIKWQQQQKI